TLQATALVHEAYLRLVDTKHVQRWNSRGHFFAAAAEAIRRILIDDARRKKSDKRGGGWHRQRLMESELAVDSTSDGLFAVDQALSQLATREPEAARLGGAALFRRPVVGRGSQLPGNVAAHRLPQLGLCTGLATASSRSSG